MPRFSPSAFFGPSKCVVPTPVLTSECAGCLCVCVYTHIRSHTLPPHSKNAEPAHPRPLMLMNKLHIYERMCTPSAAESVFAYLKMY